MLMFKKQAMTFSQSLVKQQSNFSLQRKALLCNQHFKFSQMSGVPKPKRDDSLQEPKDESAQPMRQRRPNIFRPNFNEESKSDLKSPQLSSTSAFDDHESFKASNSGLNVGLAAFYSLPKLGKEEADQILQELRVDMDHQWTPSKLVAELDKHIVS